ncbi:hypothetical protein BC830DRAFT_1064758 [Chytriomyces sp. MP71]|nr:hypothetical protein BC830DRAFT_1064758 [Chytriomyces sp. MP71]
MSPGFKKVSLLKAHNKTHVVLRPFECDICRNTFARNHDLKRHVRSVHNSRRPHACRRCKAAFVRSADLERHISKLHRVPRGGYRIKR